MKLKYIGESFGVDSLTDGKNYEATDEGDFYRVIDDSGENYLYSKVNPAPYDSSSFGGVWLVIEKQKHVLDVFFSCHRKYISKLF